MGIFDRDYYHQRGNPQWGQSPHAEQPLRSTPGTPPVVRWLLIVNCAVFVLVGLLAGARVSFFERQRLYAPQEVRTRQGVEHAYVTVEAPSRFDQTFGLLPSNLIGRFYVWQLVTYQFIHGDFFHILFNMFALFMIGRFVERQIGSRAFLLLYLLGGVFAGLTNLLSHMFTDMPTIGASGSICAVVATFGLMNPNARLMLFVMFIPILVRARTFVILFAALTVVFALIGRSGIADLAHLGGLVFGWMYVYNILYLRRLIGGYGAHSAGAAPRWRDVWRRLRGLWRRLQPPRTYRGQPFEDAAYRDVTRPAAPEWDARIDEILDKMSRQGLHTLTPEEWELLDRYRRRGRRG